MPAGEVEPTGHAYPRVAVQGEHAVEVPAVAVYVPAGHCRQEEEEMEALKGLYVPGGHGVGSAEPGGQKLPKVQLKQEEFDAAPVAGLYVPAGHCVAFMEERGQNEPAGHITGAPEEQ